MSLLFLSASLINHIIGVSCRPVSSLEIKYEILKEKYFSNIFLHRKQYFFVLCYSCAITSWAIEPANILLILIMQPNRTLKQAELDLSLLKCKLLKQKMKFMTIFLHMYNWVVDFHHLDP